MNLNSEETQERNAHLVNYETGQRGVLRERNGVAVTASLVEVNTNPNTGNLLFHFASIGGNIYYKRETDKYWDFEVKAGN